MFSKHKANTLLIQEPEHTGICCSACDPLDAMGKRLEDKGFLRKKQAGIVVIWIKTLGCILPSQTRSGQYLRPQVQGRTHTYQGYWLLSVSYFGADGDNICSFL